MRRTSTSINIHYIVFKANTRKESIEYVILVYRGLFATQLSLYGKMSVFAKSECDFEAFKVFLPYDAVAS